MLTTILAMVMLLAGSEWGYPDGGDLSLQFGDRAQVSGSGGCNRFAGTYTQSETAVTIGPLIATKMACEAAVMARERVFLDMLRAVRFADISHAKLVLKDGDGKAIAVLNRRDWD
jgi:heat shock protein HslJ